MTRSITTYVLWFLLAAPFAAQAQQWVEHRPADGGYRIEFPRAPVVTSQDVTTNVGVVKLHVATVEVGPVVAYVTLHNAFPAGSVGEPQAALDRARQGGLAGGKRTLIDEQRLTVSGQPARRLVMEEVASKLILVALIVASGDNLYQAIFVAPDAQKSADGQRFLNSFAL